MQDLLNPVSGEFVDPKREAAFRKVRLPENLRYARLFFLFSLALNLLFLARDWPDPSFPPEASILAAHIVVVAASLIGLIILDERFGVAGFDRFVILWQITTSVAVVVMITARSDMGLFQALIRPAIFYLLLPTSFRSTLFNGLGSGGALVIAYVASGSPSIPLLGLLLAAALSQGALLGLFRQSGRLRRLQFAAQEAERQSRLELIENRARFEAMFRSVPLPLIVTRTSDGKILNTNDAADEYFGKEVLQNLQSVRDLYPDPVIRDHFRKTLLTDRKVIGYETRMILPNGDERDVMISASTVPYGDCLQTIGAVLDISARKAAEERVWRSAHHDVLTGLPNRLLFQTRFEEALKQAEAEGREIALVLIDLDDFKLVNDTLGHDTGDALLYEVAARLGEVVGESGFVARLGGDEFVVTMFGDCPAPGSVRLKAEILVERMLLDLRRPFLHQGRIVSARASLGIAIYPSDANEPSDLLKNADLALYAAKASGRNRAEFFAPSMRTALESRVAVAQEIRPAISEGHVMPFYQPKVLLETGEVRGFEALARWAHPERGLLTPVAFETAFDEPDIAIELGESMLKQAAQDMRRWLDAGLEPGRLAVNLSSCQFAQPDLAERILGIFARAGVQANRFDVEVTETVLLGRTAEQVSVTLDKLHRAGVRVALDDFGTGYASLTHLKQFPVDDIKIDRSFVRDLERDAGDAAIIAAVIELGRNLGLNVVGEGVETEGQASFLRWHGCALGQGYLFAKPMPASRVPWLLRHGVKGFAEVEENLLQQAQAS